MCSVMSSSLRPHGLQPARLLCPWNSPGKNTRVGCHFLLQGIFPAQGSKPRVLCTCISRWILYHCTNLGSPQKVTYMQLTLTVPLLWVWGHCPCLTKEPVLVGLKLLPKVSNWSKEKHETTDTKSGVSSTSSPHS